MSQESSSAPNTIALVDCNNFYVSCERVFRPDWVRRPLGVLSNNDGCIVSRSYELKAAGIPMGAPYFKYQQRLKALNAIVVSSNYALYADMSTRVMDTLREFAPDIEVYSIDEAWLDLSGLEGKALNHMSHEIVNKTRQYTGIPVSMGIGSTKTLAKIASHLCKKYKIPGQVYNLNSASHNSVLNTVQVEDIWGIGRRWAAKLHAQNIHTAYDLKIADIDLMKTRYTLVMQRLISELRGIPCLEREDVQPKKQIIASRSFGERITAKTSLMESLATHTARAAEKLRAQHSICGAIQVFIQTGRFNPKEIQYSRSMMIKCPTATADTRTLISMASKGLDAIYQSGPRYAKSGVMLMDIASNQAVQTSLFDEHDSNHSKKIMQLMDSVNKRYGKNTLFIAAQGIHKPWDMKRERMTPAYTTQWSDIPWVKS